MHQIRMFVLILATLLFSVRGSAADTGLTQKPTVMMPSLTEGQQTTLTCTAPGRCSGSDPKFTWTWRGKGENDFHIMGNFTVLRTENLTAVPQNHSSTLTFKPSAEHNGTSVTCKVTFANNITTEETVTLNVNFSPRILNSSSCEVQSEVLSCVCISEGLPLPAITFPLLKTHTEYSIITSVSNHKAQTSFTVSTKDHNYTTVRCVSRNDVGEANKSLTVTINEFNLEDLLNNLLIIVKQPQVIIAFSIGIFLSGTFCCLVGKCHRNKQKTTYGLEMMTTQAVPLMDAGQAVENDGTHDQGASEGGAQAAEQSASGGDMEPKEVEYSNIDFSRWNTESPTVAEGVRDTKKTEYAEIKIEGAEGRQDSGGEDGEKLEGHKKEEVGMVGEERETEQCLPEVGEKEDVAVYSNVDEIMDEVGGPCSLVEPLEDDFF